MQQQSNRKPIIVAVDGLSAAGKGTIAKELAKELGFEYLSSGYIYRTVAFLAKQAKIDPHDNTKYAKIIEIAKNLTPNSLSQHIIKPQHLETPEISHYSSTIATIKELRDALIAMQRNFPNGKVGVVIDGRDIGTVIFPDADYKFFIITSKEVRAKRRYEQLKNSSESNENISYESVLCDLQKRDDRDRCREIAPTIAAQDAIIINNSSIDISAAVNQILKQITVK